MRHDRTWSRSKRVLIANLFLLICWGGWWLFDHHLLRISWMTMHLLLALLVLLVPAAWFARSISRPRSSIDCQPGGWSPGEGVTMNWLDVGQANSDSQSPTAPKRKRPSKWRTE